MQLFVQAAFKRGYRCVAAIKDLSHENTCSSHRFFDRSVVYNRRGHGGTSLLPVPVSEISEGVKETPAAVKPMHPSGAAETPPPTPFADGCQTPTADDSLKPSVVSGGVTGWRPKIFPKHVNMDDMKVKAVLRLNHVSRRSVSTHRSLLIRPLLATSQDYTPKQTST